MATTRIGTHINAPRSTVYRLLLEADAVTQWMMPDGMSCEVHRFEPEAGGSFSITVTNDEPSPSGIAELQHDAYYGRFLSLVPDERVVEVMEFVTGRPDMEGAQSITFSLSDAAGGGTDLEVLHEDVPQGLTAADNETHWRMGLRKLAALAERGTVD
ncbi:activator of HSP90 ATPase [Nocardia sp. MH4]|uniref:SRPBCC domain-containing protein n=1 Tax=Nocardia sp. MH4 TaxID=1768677 RepID=UPI001C4FF4B7|nr:SRPBCC domain-containing protein [Nocardia sp. MH4]MBW0269571.1 activator of HSP90 ATPase [Nocardia sp. MH4]